MISTTAIAATTTTTTMAKRVASTVTSTATLYDYTLHLNCAPKIVPVVSMV